MSAERDSAARLDAAIDLLLDHPGRPVAVDDEDDLLATARLLRSVLPGFHPRFGFEERLAGRLASAGRSGESSAGELIVLQRRRPIVTGTRHVGRLRRALLAGGAIVSGASLAVSIAAAALLAWRHVRASGGTL